MCPRRPHQHVVVNNRADLERWRLDLLRPSLSFSHLLYTHRLTIPNITLQIMCYMKNISRGIVEFTRNHKFQSNISWDLILFSRYFLLHPLLSLLHLEWTHCLTILNITLQIKYYMKNISRGIVEFIWNHKFQSNISLDFLLFSRYFLLRPSLSLSHLIYTHRLTTSDITIQIKNYMKNISRGIVEFTRNHKFRSNISLDFILFSRYFLLRPSLSLLHLEFTHCLTIPNITLQIMSYMKNISRGIVEFIWNNNFQSNISWDLILFSRYFLLRPSLSLLASGVDALPDNSEHNPSNKVLYEKYFKGDCWIYLELQLSVKYFLRFNFIFKIFLVMSITVPFAFGVDALPDNSEHNPSNKVLYEKYFKGNCWIYLELQLSVKYFLRFNFIFKIFPATSITVPFASGVDALPDNSELNPSNKVLYEKYFKGDCWINLELQLSVKYFSKYYFVFKIFPVTPIYVPFPSGVHASPDNLKHNSWNKELYEKYFKGDCWINLEPQVSVKYFSNFFFFFKIFPATSITVPFASGMHALPDNSEHNPSNKVLYEKYFKGDCWIYLELQLSVQYFLRFYFGFKIFPATSITVPFASGVDALPDNFEHYPSNKVLYEKYFKGDCWIYLELQHSVKYFSRFYFVFKIFPVTSINVPFASGVHTSPDNSEHNPSNKVLYEKYFKGDCWIYLELQVSVKYFLRFNFIFKIFPVTSINVPFASGVDALPDNSEHNPSNKVLLAGPRAQHGFGF